jgi:hypothetical protein
MVSMVATARITKEPLAWPGLRNRCPPLKKVASTKRTDYHIPDTVVKPDPDHMDYRPRPIASSLYSR